MRSALQSALLLAAALTFTACGDDDPTSPNPNNNNATDITWSQDASNRRSNIGQTFAYNCSPNGTLDTVWGSDIYTDDSSICTAGVHAGKITRTAGGTVTIEMRPAQTTYASSTRNGVTSSSYGSWGGSFIVK
jgi:predicted small lipoprotein YifL